MNPFKQGLVKEEKPFYQTFFFSEYRFFLSHIIWSKKVLSFVLLFFLIFISYSNTFHASWHLDDQPNIVNNYYLHLHNLKLKSIVATFFTNPHDPLRLGKRMYRPVACFSFALNWYFGRDNVAGYHIVNIAIHILTSFFLFLTVLCLFDTPALKDKFKNKYFIAFFSAALWALNPIQTQAITYIVQRMAAMGAMFYILGMYAYISARRCKFLFQKTAWVAACILFFLLALGSKENTAMLPMALILVEIIFFKDARNKHAEKKFFWIMAGIGVLIVLTISFFFLNGHPFSLLNGYNNRPFSLTERLLAEPRIIVYYLSQIFYPVPGRFSIAHDVILSSSFFKPWTTIPAILIIVFLIGYGISQIKKRPVLSFAILFFFLNQIIESSVLPLELVFEHRNYLPSLFLFFPVACAFNDILNFYKDKNKLLFSLTILSVILIIATLCTSTFIRNKAWANNRTLWIDALAKAPQNARAVNTLAIELAWGKHSVNPHRYNMALKLFKKSLNMYMPRSSLKAGIIGNMASIYYNNKHDYKKAVLLFKRALALQPDNLKIRHDLISPLIMMGRWKQALKQADFLISKQSDNENYYNIKGFILLWQKKYKKSLVYFKKALALSPERSDILLNTGVAFSLTGDYSKAEKILHHVMKNSPEDIRVFFHLIENSLRAHKPATAEKYTKKLFTLFNSQAIESTLKNLDENYHFPPVSRSIISPFIEKELAHRKEAAGKIHGSNKR